jgi:hypothetical protein
MITNAVWAAIFATAATGIIFAVAFIAERVDVMTAVSMVAR